MARVLSCCASGGPVPAAHPSYPDRDGFGRTTMAMSESEIFAAVRAQCQRLAAIAIDNGLVIGIVKPHGALYHDANAQPALALAVVDAARAALGDALIVIGPPTGAIADVTRDLGLQFWREGFADRRRRADGTLVPRAEPDALITDPGEAATQAVQLAAEVEIIACHGDTPGALSIAAAIRMELHRRRIVAARGTAVDRWR